MAVLERGPSQASGSQSVGPRGPQTLVSVCKVKTFHIILGFSAIFIRILPRVYSGLFQRLRDITVTVDGMCVCTVLRF